QRGLASQLGAGRGSTLGGAGTANISQPPSTTFGPGNNLINRQFNPTASGRLQGTQGQANTAAGNVAGFQQGRFQGVAPGQAEAGISAGTFGQGADTAAARAGITQDLASLRGGPSRGELAQQTFSQLQEVGEPAFRKRLQNVGRKAAAFGRIGSGVTTSELGDVLQNRERDLDLARRGLATESAGLEIGDRFSQLGATRGAAGQLFGQDVTGAGVGLGLRGEARGERGARQQFGQQDFQNRLAQLGAISGLEGQQFGQERAGREELRGERGFQFGADQTAQDRRIQQRVLEEQFLNSQFNRNARDRDLFAGVGFNPSVTPNLNFQQQQAAGSLGNQAFNNQSAAAGAFRNLGRGGPPPGQLPVSNERFANTIERGVIPPPTRPITARQPRVP
ncbi:hypothetical protein LCGC14_2728810, partial [marine sediment metagenome]